MLSRAGRHKLLTRSFGDNDDGVPPGDDTSFQPGKESMFPLKFERDLRNQSEVHFLAGQRGACGNGAGVAAHKLHQADSVGNALGFSVRAIQHFARFVEGRLVPERLPDVWEVIVNRLRYANDGEWHSPPLCLGRNSVCASLRAVAAHREQEVDT